jgi:hypothetical protein
LTRDGAPVAEVTIRLLDEQVSAEVRTSRPGPSASSFNQTAVSHAERKRS